MESLEIDEDKEGTDSTQCTVADGPQTKRSKRSKKDSSMHFLLGTLSEKESINTSTDELEHFLKCQLLILTPMPWNGGKQLQRDFPLCP